MISPKLPQFSSLSLNGLLCQVHLGVSKDERARQQAVLVDLELRFETLPEGCLTDQIGDTACYGELSQLIREVCAREPFLLIERLGVTLYQSLKRQTPPGTALWIQVTKVQPPIADLQGGARFACGDWQKS